MTEEPKCKDCKWLTGKKNIRGIECMNPKNQEKWNEAKTLWMGELRKDSARYKQGSALACKKFEAKESEHMGRYIDADALIAELQKDEEHFDKEAEDCRKNSRNYTDCYIQAMSSRADGIRDAIIEVYDAPSIDIEPKRGEWKRRIVDNGFNADWVCSECGYRVKTDFVDYNFCPNCGADMREVRDE